MRKILVGYTGFVGSNLCYNEKFDGLYDSKNIAEAYDTKPELLVYSGIPSKKFIANNFPDDDFKIINTAINNIKQISPKKIVLISTIDIYKNPINADEDTEIIIEGLEPYGGNRYYMEEWVKENFTDYLIVHLPALYGKNIKKNFIYDLINIIPTMLKEDKYIEIINKNNFIDNFYVKENNGFYRLTSITNEQKKQLKDFFITLGFSAINFTDSRAIYQFYNLKFLWTHIKIALEKGIKILNLATEPVEVQEIYQYIKNQKFINEITDKIPNYNFKTRYDYLLNGKNGYIFSKKFILEDIKKFVKEESQEQ